MGDEFQEELRALLNKYGKDSAANTPDYQLAEYLTAQLDLLTTTLTHRDGWWGFIPAPGNPRLVRDVTEENTKAYEYEVENAVPIRRLTSDGRIVWN